MHTNVCTNKLEALYSLAVVMAWIFTPIISLIHIQPKIIENANNTYLDKFKNVSVLYEEADIEIPIIAEPRWPFLELKIAAN